MKSTKKITCWQRFSVAAMSCHACRNDIRMVYGQRDELATTKLSPGTLKVDLIHVDDGKEVSIKDNPSHKIFDYDKWEPGYTGDGNPQSGEQRQSGIEIPAGRCCRRRYHWSDR